MKKYKQRAVTFKRSGATYDSVVLANVDTDAIHVAASAYLLAKSMGGAGSHTLNSYASVIKSLVEEVESDSNLSSCDDLTDAHMTQYLESVLYNERQVSPSTLNFHIIVLQGWFKWCYAYGHFTKPDRFNYYVSRTVKLKLKKLLGRSSSLDPYKLHHKYIPPLEFDELMRYEVSKNSYNSTRNEIILRLGYQVGLRASEAVSFNNLSLPEINNAIDFSKRNDRNGFEIDIIGKGSNGGKIRTVYIPDDLRRKIERFIGQYSIKLKHHNLICSKNGLQLNSTYASKIFRDAKNNLILKAESKISERWDNLPLRSYHSLRHSYATNLARRVYSGDLKDRVPRSLLQERLGHESFSTSAIYIHFSAIIWNEYEKITDELAEDVISSIESHRRYE